MRLKRRPDWRSRLTAAIEAKRRAPYALGGNDCALFAADCVLAMTGVDLAAGFRGRYGTEAEARALIESSGHEDLAGLIGAMLPAIHPSRARQGDLAGFASPRFGLALGVVAGERINVLRPEGVGSMGLLEAAAAFRVG